MNYLTRIEEALRHLGNAAAEIDKACERISTIRGLAGEWDRLRKMSQKVRLVRDKFEATIERRSKALAEMNKEST